MDGRYFVEKFLSNNNFLVRKLGANRTQVLHRIRLRLCTLKQPIHDVQKTSQGSKLDPEVIIKHDDTHARAWESKYEAPIFDKGQHEPNADNSLEITVRHDLPNEETCTILGTKHKGSPNIFSQIFEVGDGTDTDHYMESDAELNSEQLSPTDIILSCTKYDLRHNLTTNCNDDYRY